MRIAKESIFSGLNNLCIASIISFLPYNDKFVFTEAETEEFLSNVGIEYKMDEVRDW